MAGEHAGPVCGGWGGRSRLDITFSDFNIYIINIYIYIYIYIHIYMYILYIYMYMCIHMYLDISTMRF